MLALHEAYKTYQDERILDGLWGQADYFSHHVLFYQRLGMVNQNTSMPNGLFKDKKTLKPKRHDRLVQAWPLLYHYTGWQDVYDRYKSFENARRSAWVSDWFLQTGEWEREVRPKSSNVPPDKITDLHGTREDREGITLTWTSPKDDGATGRAKRYFVKFSDKPIVTFAPTDNPARYNDKARIVREVEAAITDKKKREKLKSHNVSKEMFGPEKAVHPLYDPD